MLKSVFYQPEGLMCACGDHEPLRYIAILKFAGDLTSLNMLKGRNRKALDVGCGHGAGLVALKSLGYDVYGIDIDPANVEHARRLDLAKVMVHDIHRPIPFDLSFDLITCIGVIEELRTPILALENMASKLRPSGILLVITANKHTEFLRNLYLFVKGVRPKNAIFWQREHISVKSLTEWKRNLATILRGELRLVTNFAMLQFDERCLFVHVPYLGSSSLIVAVRK